MIFESRRREKAFEGGHRLQFASRLILQGFTGKRKEFMSVPWDAVRVWSVESAGNFDRDMEVRTKSLGLPMLILAISDLI